MPRAAPFALAVPLALALALVPTASAVRDSMSITGPEIVDASSGLVDATLFLELRVEDFYCPEARTFVVHLNATPDPNISAVVAPELVFQVPEGSYLIEPYEARAAFNVTIVASSPGNVVVFATFEAAEENCVAPGGFPSAQVGASLRVETTPTTAPDVPATPTPEPTPADDTTATNATPTNTTEANVSADEPAPTPPPADATPCAPGPTCGLIGEYDPETVEESSRDAPFVGAGLLVAALVAIALLARKR